MNHTFPKLYSAFVFFFATLLSARAEYQFLGPVETLNNGVVTLQVAIEIGRIVSFKAHGEPDWIVAFDQESIPSWHWHPWGGDRIWPTAQHLNLQIYGNTGFDPVIDGEPWQLIDKTATRLTMRSGVSPELGLQITHRIVLAAGSAKVIHTYWVERVSESPYPVHVWAITGVREGDYVLMESDASIAHAFHKPFRRWPEIYPEAPVAALIPDSRILKFNLSGANEQKVGTYGSWIAMVSGRQVFRQRVDFNANELFLELSNLQAYYFRERGTFEIETLSPTWVLSKGETQEWEVEWELIELPKNAQTVSSIAAFLSDQFESK